MEEQPNDPFAQARRPFWISAIGLVVLTLIAWANGWIEPFWSMDR